VAQLATTFEMSKATIYNWLKQERIDRGEIEGLSTDQAMELAAARRRIRQLETIMPSSSDAPLKDALSPWTNISSRGQIGRAIDKPVGRRREAPMPTGTPSFAPLPRCDTREPVSGALGMQIAGDA
jgi:hypothetical protein